MSPAFERLGHKIVIDPVTACWLWQGYRDALGYGRIHLRRGPGGHQFTHRLAYTLDRGAIPDGLVLDHLCRVSSCCNPDHLEPVPVHTNNLRGEGLTFTAEGRCASGEHDITVPGAIRVINNAHFTNKRLCIECDRRTGRESAARRRARKQNPSTHPSTAEGGPP